MILCHCHGVSDRTIREAVKDGARTRREVALACGAGRSCGGCRTAVVDVIDEETNEAPRIASSPLAATG